MLSLAVKRLQQLFWADIKDVVLVKYLGEASEVYSNTGLIAMEYL